LRGELCRITSIITQSAQTSALAQATRRGEEAGPEYAVGSFPLRLLGSSVLELAISPSFFRPIFLLFLNGRFIKLSNANIKALGVLYDFIGALFF
jgi:hypothetical protein